MFLLNSGNFNSHLGTSDSGYMFVVISNQCMVPICCYFSLPLTNIFCQSDMTGVVVDIGDGAPHIVPVVNGYVIGSSIKSFPFSGSDVTQFVSQLLQVFRVLHILL